MALMRAFSILGIIALTLTLLVIGQELLIPIVIAFVLFFLINVAADGIQKIIPKWRWLAITIAILGFCFLAWIPLELAMDSFPQLVKAAPIYQKNLEDIWQSILDFFGMTQSQFLHQVREGVNIPSLASNFAQTAATMTGQFVLILLYVAFLLVDQRYTPYKMKVMFRNDKHRETWSKVMGNITSQIKRYVWVKTFLSVLTGLFSYVVLVIVGVDFAAFWAVLIFFLNYIPTIGSIIGVVFPALLALIQFETIYPFLIVLFGCGTVQFIIGNVVEPKMMGSSLNLSTFVILLALTVWATIWGIIGAFLSVPITVILMIIFAEFDRTRWVSILLSGDGKFGEEA